MMAGFTFGLSLGIAIGSGGWATPLALVSCSTAFDLNLKDLPYTFNTYFYEF